MDALAARETNKDLRLGQRFYPCYEQTRQLPTVSEIEDPEVLDELPARVRYFTPTSAFYVQALDDDGYAVGFITDSRGVRERSTFSLPELESMRANLNGMLNFGHVVQMDQDFVGAAPTDVRSSRL